jgi:hypothetical protein
MALFDGGISLADTIARLVKSPRVQYMGNQLMGNANQYAARPLQAPNFGASAGMGNRGSSSGGNGYGQVGAIIGGFANKIGTTGANAQAAPQDPLMALYQQLIEQLQSPVNMPTGVDTENLMQQVQSAINPIYDQRAKSAEARTGRATGQVKDMYRALSNDYERLAPEQIEQADAAKQEIEALYGQLRSNIEGSYSRVSEEQGELFKSLGIEAALPEVMAEQQAPVQESLTAASENQAQQEQRYMDMGQIDSTYMREGSPNATMTGNEISTDMLAQLQDYLGQIEAERSSGIQSTYMDQLGQANTQLGQQQQMAQGETARRQEMLWQMLQGQMQGQQQQALTPDSFMGGLPQGVQQSVAGAFTSLQRSPEAVYGKVEDKRNPVPGSFVETTPQWYMAQADEMLKRGEIDATTHQALLMYLQLNFGNK